MNNFDSHDGVPEMNSSEPRIVAIVPAGGVGERASRGMVSPVPKQYRTIRGQPMLRTSVLALLSEPRVTRVYVGVQADDEHADVALQGLARVCVTPTAGATRALTVLNTVDFLFQSGGIGDNDWVLVHDAARPGLSPEPLQRLIDTCLTTGLGGLLAMPATDTVKLAAIPQTGSDCLSVQQTVDRNLVWLAQTPQMYKARTLQHALCSAISAGFDVTDESSAIEWAGEPSQLVRGDIANFKVTWPEDFELIERYVK